MKVNYTDIPYRAQATDLQVLPHWVHLEEVLVGLVGGREEAVDVRLVAVVQVTGFQILDG